MAHGTGYQDMTIIKPNLDRPLCVALAGSRPRMAVISRLSFFSRGLQQAAGGLSKEEAES